MILHISKCGLYLITNFEKCERLCKLHDDEIIVVRPSRVQLVSEKEWKHLREKSNELKK